MTTLTEKTIKLTALGAALGCKEAAPGVIVDERLAELQDEGATSARGWGMEIHRGRTIIDVGDSVERVLKANRLHVVERYRVPCPQAATGDCAGDGKHERIFECPIAGCDFVGCSADYDAHVLEPHSSDSAVMSEMVNGIGGAR